MQHGRYGWKRVILASELEPDDLPTAQDPVLAPAPFTPAPTSVFRKLYDLSLTIPITEARNLLLSSPPGSHNLSTANSTPSPMLFISPTVQGPPTWPQNLMSIYIDAPPGVLATPMEIRAFFVALALACGGPSLGSREGRPARLERVGVVCSTDPDSGYESLCGAYGTLEADGEERYLSRKTFEPLLEVFDTPLSSTPDAPVVRRPKFALRSFDIMHHFPIYLTQEDVELIAQTWGSCIEKLTLNDEPIAGFSLTPMGLQYPLSNGVEPTSDARRPEASLTLAALLPFAKYCTQLKHLGLFIDATRGVRGLMKPIFNPQSLSIPVPPAPVSPSDLDVYTFNIARRYLSNPLTDATIPDAYPIFRKLERLSFGISPISVTLPDLDLDFSMETSESDPEAGQSEPYNTFMSQSALMSALKHAARLRVQEEKAPEAFKGVPSLGRTDEKDDEYFFLKYVSTRGVRLGMEEEDELEAEERGGGPLGVVGDDDSSSLVPLFLGQILPCFPSQESRDGSKISSGAFTTVIGAGTTWMGGPSALMSSSMAIQNNWTVSEPYEEENIRQRRRKWREDRARQHQQQENQQNLQILQNALVAQASVDTDVDVDVVATLNATIATIQTDAAGGSQDTSQAVVPAPTQPAPPPPPPDDNASGSLPAIQDATGTSSVVIPFLPSIPVFSEPTVYVPPLLSSVFRARVKKWLEMNRSVLPMAVAMREAGRVWGNEVSDELVMRRGQVDELSVRVGLMSGLVQARSGRKRAHGEGGVPEGCVVQ